MQLSRFLSLVTLALLPVCLVATTWLYCYPVFHGCTFPVPELSIPSTTIPRRAPFRLLALGDPQLEGDSSLPIPGAPAFRSLQYLSSELGRADSWTQWRYILQSALRESVRKDLPKWLEGHRKRLDLWGNDLYLGHIVRQLRWWTQPSHVAVLGDLLGSQWIRDEEFARRARRYWSTVFEGMERVPDTVMAGEDESDRKRGLWVELLGEDKNWEKRVINIAGNHDIGYAGDLDEGRVERFETAFGKVNWDIVFELPRPPTNHTEGQDEEGDRPALRLVILNSMNLDAPAMSEFLQRATYDFMNHIVMTSRPVTDKSHATILLTHIPLHKDPGICVDGPFFDFFNTGSGVKEQNMLSVHASKTILESIFGLSGNPHAEGQGLGRRGIIINGHDHEGCDVLHYISQNAYCSPSMPLSDHMAEELDVSYPNATQNPEWRALRIPSSSASPLHPLEPTELGECISYKETPSIREVTLRSMMGDFSGYAGFLSGWFDEGLGENGEWRLEFATCGIGVQHWWWAVHVMDLVFVAVLLAGALTQVAGLIFVTKHAQSGQEKGYRGFVEVARPNN